MSAPDEAAASTPPTQQPMPTIDASDPNLTFRDVFEALRRGLNPTPALERLLELHGSDAEDLLADTNPYLLALTATVSMLHTLFEMLAFKSDVKFWRQRASKSKNAMEKIRGNASASPRRGHHGSEPMCCAKDTRRPAPFAETAAGSVSSRHSRAAMRATCTPPMTNG